MTRDILKHLFQRELMQISFEISPFFTRDDRNHICIITVPLFDMKHVVILILVQTFQKQHHIMNNVTQRIRKHI